MADRLTEYLKKYGDTSPAQGSGSAPKQAGDPLSNYLNKYGTQTYYRSSGLGQTGSSTAAFDRYKSLMKQNEKSATKAYDQAKSNVGVSGFLNRTAAENQDYNTRKQKAAEAAGGDYSGWAMDEVSSANMYGGGYSNRLFGAWRDFLDNIRAGREAAKKRGEDVTTAYKNKQDAEAQAAIAANPEAYKAQQKAQQDKQRQIDAWGRENGGWNANTLKKAQEVFYEADKKYNDIANGTAALDPTQDKEYQDYMSQAQEWGQRQVAEGEWQSTDYDNYMREQEDIARQEYERRAMLGGSQRYYSDTELTAAARERERAKMVLDYAQQHQYDNLDKAEDFVTKADEGEAAFREYQGRLFVNEDDRSAYEQEMSAARDLADNMGLAGEERRTYLESIATDAYRNYQNKAANASQWDPRYNTAFQEPDERWTEEERQKFYYLFATDRERANQYGAEINQKYNAEEAAERDLRTEEFATRNVGTGALATAGAVAGHLLGGTMDFARMAAENAYRGDLYQTQYEGISRTGDVATSAIAQDLNNRWGTIDSGVPVLGGKGWGDVYQLFESMVESGASIYLAGGGIQGLEKAAEISSLASFFGMAASSGVRDALERGADSDKAILTGFINGLAEVAGEKFSVENLLSNKGLSDFLTKGAFREILKQGGVEASEEVFTTLLNTMADLAINGNESELRAKIYANIVNGMSQEEAQKAALKEWINQLGQDALGGFLSGSVMSGVQFSAFAAPAKLTQYQGNAQGLFDYADTVGNGYAVDQQARDVADQYRKRFENTGKISNYGAARMMAATEASMRGEVENTSTRSERVREAVEEAYGSVDEARKAIDQAKDESNTEAREKAVELAKTLGMYQTHENRTGLQQKTTPEQRAIDNVDRAVRALENRDQRERESALDWKDKPTTTKQDVMKDVQLEDGQTGIVMGAKYDSQSGKIQLTVRDASGNEQVLDRENLSQDAQYVFNILEDMLEPAQAVEAFNRMNADQNVTDYATAFRTVRELGQHSNKAFSDAVMRQAGNMTEEQARFAYSLGQSMTKREGGKPIRKFSIRGTGKVTLDGGKLDGKDLAPVSEKSRKANAQLIKAVQSTARVLGIDVRMFESQEGVGGTLQGMNGAYKDGVIYLDINAGMRNINDLRGRMLFVTMAHELTHFIKENAPEQYQELQDRIVEYLQQDKGVDFNKLVQSKLARSSERLTYDGALEEVIADSCETMLRDSKAVRDLADRSPSLFNTIHDYIQRFMNRIMARHLEAKALEPHMKELQEIWDRALIAAVDNRVSEETLEDLPTPQELKEYAQLMLPAHTATRTAQETEILEAEKKRTPGVDRLASLYRQTVAIRGNLTQRLMLPAHSEAQSKSETKQNKPARQKQTTEEKKEKAAVKRRFDKAVEEYMDVSLMMGEEVSREDAEKYVMKYSLEHEGYFSMTDEARQKGTLKTKAQYKAERQAERENGGVVKFSAREEIRKMDIPWDPDEKSTIKTQLNRERARLMKQPPVKSITYDAKKNDYLQQLDKILLENFGYKINRQDGVSFLFDKGAVSKIDQYINTEGEKAAAIAAPYVLKRGEIISGHKHHKGGLYPSLTFGASVEINGEKCVEAVAVLFGDKDRVHALRVVDNNGNGFELPLIKEEATPTPVDSGVKAPVALPISVTSKNKVTQNDGVVKKSERDNARTDRELLMDTTGEELTVAERRELEKYRKKVEDYEKLADMVQQAQEDYDKVVRSKAGKDAIERARVKLSNLEKRMNRALNEVTGAETKDKTMLQIIRKEREIQRLRTSMATRETFSKRELRGRITKLYNDLNRRITSPSEKKNIPVPVMMQAIDVLEAINMDSTREGSKAGEQLRNKLLELQAKYKQLQNDPDFRNAAVYDEFVAELLTNMIEEVGDTPINRMSASQMKAVYDALTALDKTARKALKIQMAGEERDAYMVAKQMGDETRSVAKPHKNALAQWLNAQLSPERMFNRLGGYHKDSAWSQVYQMLNGGQLKMTQIQMEATMLFDGLLEGKDYDRFVDPKATVDIGLKDKDGKSIPITHGMMVALYMHMQNDQNVKHVTHGGITVPNLRDYYNGRNNRGLDSVIHAVGVSQEIGELRDRLHEAIEAKDEQAEIELKEQIREAEERADEYAQDLRDNIEKNLSDYDRQWIAASKELFDVYSKQRINEATMDVYGIKRANVDNYFPLAVNKDFLNTPFESIAKDMSLENAGFVKERVDSGKPIYLFDVSDVAKSQIRRVSQYCGLMPVTRNFQKIWGKVQTGYRGSLQDDVRDKFGTAGIKYIENLMADLNGARGGSEGPLADFFNAVRGNMAQASLTLSLRVAMGQTASYPTAASVVGWKALGKALARGGKGNTIISRADQELIRKYSPLLWYRMKGYSTTELGDIANSNSQMARLWKKMRWATGWIQAWDGATVGRLWYAAQYYVDDHNKALQKGSDAYYQEVAKVFNDIVEKTQPDYTTMQRPDILRNPYALVRQLTMFLTQRLQNFNILYDAAATYTQAKKDLANGVAGVTQQDVFEARTTARRAAVSQIVAAATITAFKFLADGILHSMKGYRDDDEDLTPESVSIELLDMFIDSLAGNVLGGGEVYDLVEKYAFGKTYYGIEVSGVSTVTDVVESATKFLDSALEKGATPKEVWDKGGHKLAKNISSLLGMPLANGEKIVMGLIYYATDIVNGEALSMEAGVERTTAQQAHRLYRAYTAANFGTANRIREQVGDDKSLNKALTEYIKDQYKDGVITQSKAAEQLRRYAGKDADTATKMMREYSAEVETGIKYDNIASELLEGNIRETDAAKMWQKYGGFTAEKAKVKAAWTIYRNDNPKTRFSDGMFDKYYTTVKPTGVDAVVFEEIRYGGDTNGNGSITQAEAAAAIANELQNGRLTESQAETIWKAIGSNWKKTYAQYVKSKK